jgi:hypothetical protein
MKTAAGISAVALMYLFGEHAVIASGVTLQNFNTALPILALFILLGGRALYVRR